MSILLFLSSALRALPLEVALTFGLILFVLSWVYPRRIVDLPQVGMRARILAWSGVVGSLLVVAVATLVSAVAASGQDVSGYDGWWRRPAPLVAAVFVVAVAAFELRRVPRPASDERAVLPRRAWPEFASRTLLWMTGITAAVLALTATWQIAIATAAPVDGPFFGSVPEYSRLPIYMRFSGGYGYLSGAGWPNHLATLAVLVLAGAVLFFALRTDANRPQFARAAAAGVRTERELTARLFTLLMLGGLVASLGAVWMHTGSIGSALVGLDERWVSATRSYPQILVAGGYDAIARPMNLLGYALQGAGVALLLRLSVDTARAVVVNRRMRAAQTSHEAATIGSRP